MKNTSKTLVFFGSGPVAADSLDFLSKEFTIEAVITKAVPSHHKLPAPVETLASKLGLKTFFASNTAELYSLFESFNPTSSLGIVVDYGVIIPSSIIDSFSLKIVNSHFSLLPEWRGADPITFSILSGQKKTGVSLMVIEPELDTGKLITRKSIKIENNENTATLTSKLIPLSNELMGEYIPLYMNGQIKPKNQPHPNRATYSKKISKSDGKIHLSKPAKDIEREIRAYIGWPASYVDIFNKTIKITKAHVSAKANTNIDLKCGDGEFIVIDELIAPSGKKMSAEAFINGYAVS